MMSLSILLKHMSVDFHDYLTGPRTMSEKIEIIKSKDLGFLMAIYGSHLLGDKLDFLNNLIQW